MARSESWSSSEAETSWTTRLKRELLPLDAPDGAVGGAGIDVAEAPSGEAPVDGVDLREHRGQRDEAVRGVVPGGREHVAGQDARPEVDEA